MSQLVSVCVTTAACLIVVIHFQISTARTSGDSSVPTHDDDDDDDDDNDDDDNDDDDDDDNNIKTDDDRGGGCEEEEEEEEEDDDDDNYDKGEANAGCRGGGGGGFSTSAGVGGGGGGGSPFPFQGSSSCIGVHLPLSSHLWLQEAVACDSGHTPVNRFGWRAKPGEGGRSGLKPSGEPDRGCLPKHAKTGPGGVSGQV